MMFFPDGSLSIALPPAFEKRTAEPPEDLTSFPPSPGLSSMLQTLVPSGMLERGRMFPDDTSAEAPN